eukprot:1160727-Pelagomonas_calceolata.AAC.21
MQLSVYRCTGKMTCVQEGPVSTSVGQEGQVKDFAQAVTKVCGTRCLGFYMQNKSPKAIQPARCRAKAERVYPLTRHQYKPALSAAAGSWG